MITETEFQQQIITLAQLFHWTVAHFRPARVKDSPDGEARWVTAVAADGKGFPDLVLVHAKAKRVLFVELKCGKNKLSADQKKWRDALLLAGADWREWRPEKWDEIEEELIGK